MRFRIALLGLLILAASCSERASVTHAQGLPIDKRYGPARLDSAFELNDPYAAFGRPKAKVSMTPVAIRDLFRNDLEALFGTDSFAKSQLDSGSQIIVFNQKLKHGIESFVMHVSDMIAGDQYFLYLRRGNQVSPKPWRWYGPSAEKELAPGLPESVLTSTDTGNGKTMLIVNEWRHNGNVYSAWIRTLLNIGADLSLGPEFRFESVATLPFGNKAQAIHRTATFQATTGQYAVRISLATGSTEKPLGSVTMSKEGQRWNILSREITDKKYEKLIWSANPAGEQAIWENMPGTDQAQTQN
jgi:hypothetical protein